MTLENDCFILADTSVWIDHFRFPNQQMYDRLNDGLIVIHPFVLGELALGSLANRGKLLKTLDQLTQVSVARDHEVRQLIENRGLFNTGIGWVDAHLLASVLLDPPIKLWTKDKRLSRTAADVGLPLHPGSLPN